MFPVADPQFVANLRAEVGYDTLDVVWLTKGSLDDEDRRPAHLPETGLWAVVSRMPLWNAAKVSWDTGFAYVDVRQWVVYDLAGRGGLPVEPGSWLVEVLHRSDLRRHGRDRLAELDAFRQQVAENEHKLTSGNARELARDHAAYRVFKKTVDEMGVEAPLKEELIAMERQAEQALIRDEAEHRKHVKELGFHGNAK